MIIALWADKGGTGKTTIACMLAWALEAHLVDLDPQGDTSRWAWKANITCSCPTDEVEVQGLISAKANSEDLVIVDCPTGQNWRALTALGNANLVVVPTRTSEADLMALDRCLGMLAGIRKLKNPGMMIGVVLNFFKETSRARTIREAILNQTDGNHYIYLGHLGERTEVEERYSRGEDFYDINGKTSFEAKLIVDKIFSIINQHQ